ncbi:MAG: sensor histidine kinase [Caulobacter sp.]|nr:sensor histidine kinase [Caulobacter sp.]
MHSPPPEYDARLASREANHRLLNTLTALQGLLRADLGSFPDPAVREAVTVFGSRIQAFASVHRTLDDDDGEPLVDMADHLTRLCADLCAAHLEPRGVYCELRCEPGRLPREACQKLSLIIVELVTNAAKHAFADRGWGRVSVSFQRGDQAWICQVADNGAGLHGEHKGAGGGLIQSLAQTLGAELQIQSDWSGHIVTLSLPRQATPCDRTWR